MPMLYCPEGCVMTTTNTKSDELPWWVVVTGNGGGMAVPVGIAPIVIGRDPSCDIVVLGTRVSKRHAELRVVDGRLTVRDMGSAHGLLVNGTATTCGELVDGDTFVIDGTVLQVTRTPTAVTYSTTAMPDDVTTAPPADPVSWTTFSAFVDELRGAAASTNLLATFLEGLVGLVGAERGFVLTATESGEFTPAASHRMAADEERLVISRTVCRRVFQRRTAVLIDDSRNHPDSAGAESLVQAAAPRSILCCPLVTGDRVLGVLYLDRRRTDAPWVTMAGPATTTLSGFAAELLALHQTRRRLDASAQVSAERDAVVFGDDEGARQLAATVESAARQDVTVLLLGETGTGKEMLARHVHRLSPRRTGPFVPVHCAALAPSILEAELFGVERGAYTGATESRPGRFELASGGTLFLDEVAEIPHETQIKLLRVLQERRVVRVGGTDPIDLDFRLVCATNGNVEQLVKDGALRQDFYYRINVFRVDVPALRQRPDEILPLARHFLAELGRQCGRRFDGFTAEAEQLLLRHLWPGNIRELRNAVERAVVMAETSRIDTASLPAELRAPAVVPTASTMDVSLLPLDFDAARDVFERAFLERSIARCRRNMRAVCRETGIARNTLYRKLAALGMAPRE